jgi:hypothetical protein
MILSYFSAGDIVGIFHNVSKYIDAVIRSYDQYPCNFIDISKANFDLVCRLIRPEQVVALTLSDGKQTPGMINIFLGQFQLEQFVRIRSLHLHQIYDSNLFDRICLTKLPPLTRISVSDIICSIDFSTICGEKLRYVDCECGRYTNLSHLCEKTPMLRDLRARFYQLPPRVLLPILSPHLIRLHLEFHFEGSCIHITYCLTKDFSQNLIARLV